jgi:hypothetical protein
LRRSFSQGKNQDSGGVENAAVGLLQAEGRSQAEAVVEKDPN